MTIRGAEMGAELAEMYKKGKDLGPTVGQPIATAGGEVSAELVYAELYRTGSLGCGTYGCGDDFLSVQRKLDDTITALGDTMVSVGINVVKTARDYADVDSETEAAFKQHGGEF